MNIIGADENSVREVALAVAAIVHVQYTCNETADLAFYAIRANRRINNFYRISAREWFDSH